MDWGNFHELEMCARAEEHKGFVYVLLVSDGHKSVPIYVGQTTRMYGRLDDYFWSSWEASTDFKVGTAIRYFIGTKGLRVFARYKEALDRRAEEQALIQELKPVLNCQHGLGYDYRDLNLDRDTVRERITTCCAEWFESADLRVISLHKAQEIVRPSRRDEELMSDELIRDRRAASESE